MYPFTRIFLWVRRIFIKLISSVVLFWNFAQLCLYVSTESFQRMTFPKDTPPGPTWWSRRSRRWRPQRKAIGVREEELEHERRTISIITWTAPESQGNDCVEHSETFDGWFGKDNDNIVQFVRQGWGNCHPYKQIMFPSMVKSDHPADICKPANLVGFPFNFS